MTVGWPGGRVSGRRVVVVVLPSGLRIQLVVAAPSFCATKGTKRLVSLTEEDLLSNSQDLAALGALVADVGEGNVIDAEILEGCPVEAHDLDEMDADQAAQVAAHCFSTLFDHRVEQIQGVDADLDEGLWSGTLDGFGFVIRRDSTGDLILDFSASAG